MEGGTKAKQRAFWRDLIDGQNDADRMDYLLRDSYHAGVRYGRFDLHRIVNTIRAISGARGRAPRLGFSEGGWHAAEALVLARYFMFTQVYFHKTRVAFDIHLRHTLKELLPGGQFPAPVGADLKKFLEWDDWRVLGLLAEGKGGEHGKRLSTRDHYRQAWGTPENSVEADFSFLQLLKEKLGTMVVAEAEAAKSWYKTGLTDIPIVSNVDPKSVVPLSRFSSVVSNLKPNNQVLLYVRPEDADKAQEIVREVADHERTRQGALGFDTGAS